jgi:hypothetical protein
LLLKAGNRGAQRFDFDALGVELRLEALALGTGGGVCYCHAPVLLPLCLSVSAPVNGYRAANQAGGANTILLTAPASSPYVLTGVDNGTYGPTALPVISGGDRLTIQTSNGMPNPGYGDTIDAAQNGRLFAVAAGASLTLENVTLQNGRVFAPGIGVSPKGGAVYNQGTLVLSNVLVQNNAAAGWPLSGQDAAGGGVWSSGSLMVENATMFRGNSATGSYEGAATKNGGNAFGGAVYIAAGTAAITGSTFGFNNSALGGQGGPGHFGGSAYGGAVYVAGGTVTMSADVVGNPPDSAGSKSNSAQGGSLGGPAYGGGVCVAGGTVSLTNDTVSYNAATGNGRVHGGGILIAPGATVDLDSYTLAHTTNNRPVNIEGTYTLLP